MMNRTSLTVLCALCALFLPCRLAAAQAALPPDADYVVVKDGHLYGGAERVRYWGFIGWVVGPASAPMRDESIPKAERVRRAREIIDGMVNRIDDLGFNLVRLWEFPSDPTGGYTPGDGSNDDLLAYYLYKLDKKDIKLWNSTINPQHEGEAGGDSALIPENVGVVDDPKTAEAWKAAVAELIKANDGKPVGLRCGHGSVPGIARTWDARMEALALRYMRKMAGFPNKYKDNLRWADDPQFVTWELSNEELWFKGMFGGGWQYLPAFFRNELLDQWHDYLTRKYGSEDKLRAAWRSLLPGESLTAKTVLLAPLAGPVGASRAVNDTNPQAIAALKTLKQEYSRDDFARARGEDVIAFFTELWIAHKKREADALKTWGKSCRLSPTIWDSGNTFQIQASYLHQNADAVSTCAYINGMAHDPTYKRFPFYSGLEAPPRLCWDVPWMEQSAVKGKPHFVYEAQIGNRTKYRAEFPLRLTAFAAIADWDIINWHIYGHAPEKWSDKPFDGPLHIWHDFLGYGADEVQLSVMRVCADIFTKGLLKPAPNPTTFVFGRRSLYDPASMEYGRSYGDLGKRIIPTAWRYGLRIALDPTREDDAVEGLSATQGVFEPNPVRPNNEIELDWNRGHLRFDAPGALAYAGFFGERKGEPVRFTSGDGAEIRDVKIVNPPGMPYPVTPDEGYVAASLASADGKPLKTTRRAYLSAVSASFNTGYRLDVTKGQRGSAQEGPNPDGPQEFFGAFVSEAGSAPVLVARVGLTLRCPDIAGMRCRLLDWNLRPIGQTVVAKDGVLRVPADKPIFFIELSR